MLLPDWDALLPEVGQFLEALHQASAATVTMLVPGGCAIVLSHPLLCHNVRGNTTAAFVHCCVLAHHDLSALYQIQGHVECDLLPDRRERSIQYGNALLIQNAALALRSVPNGGPGREGTRRDSGQVL